MNFTFVWFIFLAALAHTGGVQTRTGAGVPIFPGPLPAADGGAHVAVTSELGAGAPAAGGGAAIAAGAGGPGVVPGGGGAAAPGPGGAGTWADVMGWLRGVGNGAMQSTRGALQWVGNGANAIGTQGNQLVHAHPYAVGVTVTAVAATAVYQYAPSALDYFFQDTQCFLDGRKDFLAMLHMHRPDGTLTQMDAWFGVLNGAQVCRTSIRFYQDQVEESVLDDTRTEREKQERQEQEQEASTEEPADTHPDYEIFNATNATREAIRKHGNQGEQQFDGTHGAGERLEGDQDEQSADEEQEPPASQTVHYTPEDYFVFSLPLIAYVLLGPYWGRTLIYLILGSIFDTLGHMLKRASRLDELEQRACAGQLNKIDYGDYLSLNYLLTLSPLFLALAGSIVVYRTMCAVWPWVAHRHPGSSIVVSINDFVNRVPSMDTISARARGIVLYLCWTLPAGFVVEYWTAMGFRRRIPAEIRER